VLLFHASRRLRGGYLGVDLFFVLSGFLITSILLEEHKRTATIDLRAFWVRRARRLLPALLSLMPAVALYARFVAKPMELRALRGDALATLGYVANWRAILGKRSYWEMFAAPSPLEHTWSLAIEEQFYVVWPLVVLALLGIFRSRGARALFWVSVGLGSLSIVAVLTLYTGGDTTRVYLGTDTRGVAILAGASLACAELPAFPARALDASGVIAACVLAWFWATLDGKSDFLYRGGFWITELCALVLIACALQRAPLVARALSWTPLRLLGLVSYGVYLWHWPIYVVLTEERVHLSGVALLGVRLGVTLGIAALSYRVLEQPIRRRGIAWGRPAVVVPSAFAAAIGCVLLSTRGAAAKLETPEVFAPTAPPPMPTDLAPPSPLRDRQATMDLLPARSELPDGMQRVLVLGDSVALSLGAMMYWMQLWDDVVVAQRAVGDCSILDGYVPVRSMSGEPHGNGNCARSWVADVKETRPDVGVVVIGGAYFSMVRPGDVPSAADPSAAKHGKRWVHVCDPGWRDAFVSRLVTLLGEIAPFAAERVVVLAAYPGEKWQTPTIDDDVDCYNRMLRSAAARGGASVLDLNGWLCPDRRCTTESRGAPVRPDGLHFSGAGAEDAGRWMLRALRHPDDTSVRSFLTPSGSPITTSVIPSASTKSGSGL
jgi:peptidoglycan/LPS O-acetylase OafA/YrhL